MYIIRDSKNNTLLSYQLYKTETSAQAWIDLHTHKNGYTYRKATGYYTGKINKNEMKTYKKWLRAYISKEKLIKCK